MSQGDRPLRLVPWRAVLRNRWIIIGCTVTILMITMGLTWLAVPVYEGSTTLRIEQKEPNLPEVFRTLSSSETRLGTEVEELRSRTLAAEVVTQLGLQLSLVEPQVRRRSSLFQNVQVTDSARAADYLLIRRDHGRFTLLNDSTRQQLGEFATGERVEFGGFSLVLAATALEHAKIRFSVGPLTDVADRVAHQISAGQPSREVNVVKVSYQSRDQELAWQVPQALVVHYIAHRQELQTLETRSTIDFLRQQISTIADQLAESESGLRSYRERFEVVNPEAESNGEVSRLISMQTQLGMLENERSALAAVLAEADAKAVGHKPGDASPYRRLLAFPTLLQTQAATGILQSLTNAEDQRKALLTRRTPEDADVEALDGRIEQLEGELRGMAATYLQGVTYRAQSLDSGLADLRRQLRSIPEKELQYARLERQPKVLEGIYTMLQTRLKEAEVAAAARDPSVRIVDPAILPKRPVSPRPALNAMAALLCGSLLGLAVAFGREMMNPVIRSRMDVRGSTGLQVIGLIPRIARKASPVALIFEPGKRKLLQDVRPPAPRVPAPEHGNYTFFRASDQPEETPAAQVTEYKPPAERASLTLSGETGAIAEAYGILQTNISFSRLDAPTKTLVFTSPLQGDGKTTTVVNLALSLGQRGLRILLIDGDVRRGVVHSIFQAARDPGLMDVLRGIHRFESARRRVSVGERGVVDYLTTGKVLDGDHGLIASDAMRDLLAAVREEYDLIIVDTPPVNIITDAAVLGAKVDGVVLVARVGVTEPTALSYAVEQLQHVRAHVLGIVLNDIDPRRDSAYDSSYKYFRGYEYSTSDR